ncbi:MAG TPA: hypothetical protein VGB37_11170 [Candidatus Lokiarchaeia archaeon]
MKQRIDLYYKEFFRNKEKIVLMLINEIIFLNHCLNKSNNQKVTRIIVDAISQLEELLDRLNDNLNNILSKKEFNNLILKSYEIFNGIVQEISASIALDNL